MEGSGAQQAAANRPGGRPALRAVRVGARIAGGLVAGFGVLVAVLYLTTPRPGAADGWSRLLDLPSARGELAAAVADNRLYVLGGLHGLGRTSAAVDVYDPATGSWRKAPDLPAPRHHLAAAALDGAVYVAGGAGSSRDWTPRTDVWVLHPGADRWEVGPSLPEGRWGHRLVALGGRLHAIGGEGESGRVLILDPETGWHAGAEMPSPRDHLGAVVVDGEIWAIGGRDAGIRARIDVYDPDADRWRAATALPSATSAAAVGVVDRSLVVIGGEDPGPLRGGIVDRHWRLDLDTGAWHDAPAPPLNVHGAADAVLAGRLVVVGGASRQGALSLLAWTAAVQVLDHPARRP